MYDIEHWANNSFIIKNDKLRLSPSNIALIDIVKDISPKYNAPFLLRFPHLIKKQIDILFDSFSKAKQEFDYQSDFRALLPLKTNQFYSFLHYFQDISKPYNYGLEAGSKAEFILAMAYNNKDTPLVINGFKDKDIIKLAFIATKLGYNTTVVIEGLNELDYIIECTKIYPDSIPFIGVRVKLHNLGRGFWENSSGINSKFGLSSNELIKAFNLFKQYKLMDFFKIIHFHIGSQMSDIKPFKKAIIEVGHIYTHLKSMGASSLDSINIGGGLAVEYSNSHTNKDINYTIGEFANDVIFLIKNATNKKDIKEPHIYIEAGRFITASHTVLVAPTIELFSVEYKYANINLKSKNPTLIDELHYMYNNIDKNTAIEYLHDSFLHMQSLLNLFDLGYIDLLDRANMEIFVNLIIKKSLFFIKDFSNDELNDIQDMIQEKYLINFSIFQSIPDFWGIGQKFPILPLDKLDTKASRSARLWDITCDSDGEMVFDKENPLYLHDIDLEKEDYYLGFFLTGAYQEILGMSHNLFVKPTEVIVDIKDNKYDILEIKNSANILDILESIGYDKELIKNKIIKEDISQEMRAFVLEIFDSDNYLKKSINDK
jgi:arginine decarboxylase